MMDGGATVYFTFADRSTTIARAKIAPKSVGAIATSDATSGAVSITDSACVATDAGAVTGVSFGSPSDAEGCSTAS